MDKKQLILIIAAVVLILAIAGIAVFYKYKKGPSGEEPEGFGSELFKKSSNPLGENKIEIPALPEGANPFEKVKTNPFSINPFE